MSKLNQICSYRGSHLLKHIFHLAFLNETKVQNQSSYNLTLSQGINRLRLKSQDIAVDKVRLCKTDSANNYLQTQFCINFFRISWNKDKYC